MVTVNVLRLAEVSFLIANGIYQIKSKGQTAIINLNDLSANEDKIKSAIVTLDDHIRELINTPPSRIKNTLHLGGKNARHFETLRNYSELRMRLTNDLARYKMQKLKSLLLLVGTKLTGDFLFSQEALYGKVLGS